MEEKFNIMIVEDEKLAGRAIKDSLNKRGFSVKLFETAEEAFLYFSENHTDLILLDYKLPGMDGEEFYNKVREINPVLPVIFMTAYSSVEKAVRLLKKGAYNYLTKPVEIDELNHNVDNIIEKLKLVRENERLKESFAEKIEFKDLIIGSECMQKVVNMALRVSNSNANVLITGESGTGKEVIANLIHDNSGRKNNTFVKVNIAALPETLIEAELFGSVKGAYTGSVQDRKGKFEEADGGSLFLDEVGDLPLEMQVKLLRAIQDKEVTRLGSNTVIKTDIRLITATNKDLNKLINEGKFREDLYFRLNVINIEIPPLKKRREDIPPLIDMFIKKFGKREGKDISSISKDAMSALIRYNYKGNIRELENIIERAIVLSRGSILTMNDLPVFINTFKENTSFDKIDESLPLPERIKIIEKNIIGKSLKKFNFNQTKTAKELGISESGLRYKIKSLDILNK